MSASDSIDATATALYERDHRFRAIAETCVAQARDAFRSRHDGQGEIRMRDVHEVALEAAILLLKRVYVEDPEVNAMRIERDRYKSLAEKALMSTVPSIVVPAAMIDQALKEG